MARRRHKVWSTGAVVIPKRFREELGLTPGTELIVEQAEGGGVLIRRAWSREQRIADEYRDAYEKNPQDPAVGEAGAILAADLIRREEAGEN